MNIGYRDNIFLDRKGKQSKPVDRELYQKARDEVLTKLSIPQYFKDHIDPAIDLSVKPSCLCPFHEEDTPSFRYKSDENYWRCFGKCQDGGTVIELHMRKFGIKNHFEGLWDLKMKFGKMYGLTFKNFFLTEDNKEISIEEILKPKKQSMSMEEFLTPKKPSLTALANKIEAELTRLKEKNLDLYIESCIYYDNLTSYKMFNEENLSKLLDKIKSL